MCFHVYIRMKDKRLHYILAAILNFCRHFEFMSQTYNHDSTFIIKFILFIYSLFVFIDIWRVTSCVLLLLLLLLLLFSLLLMEHSSEPSSSKNNNNCIVHDTLEPSLHECTPFFYNLLSKN